MRFRRHMAVFVDYGMFFARIFSALKRAGPVPMTISGENLMFGQPPILYTPLMGTSSDRRNRPSKILELFSPPFQTLCLYTHSYPVATGTRNVEKYMPNKSSFEGRGHILMYNPQKVVRSRVTPQKTTPKFQLFWPFLAWFLGQFSPRFRPLLPCATTLSNEIWTQGSPNIGLLSHKISAQTVHVGLR